MTDSRSPRDESTSARSSPTAKALAKAHTARIFDLEQPCFRGMPRRPRRELTLTMGLGYEPDIEADLPSAALNRA
jgi:hypothetical protein